MILMASSPMTSHYGFSDMAVRRASMQFILVPHQVTDTTATIWVGAIDVEEDVRQSSVSIEVDDGSENSITELDASRWKRWQSYSPGDEDSYQFLDRFLDRILAIKPSPIIKTLDFQRLDLDALNQIGRAHV